MYTKVGTTTAAEIFIALDLLGISNVFKGIDGHDFLCIFSSATLEAA